MRFLADTLSALVVERVLGKSCQAKREGINLSPRQDQPQLPDGLASPRFPGIPLEYADFYTALLENTHTEF